MNILRNVLILCITMVFLAGQANASQVANDGEANKSRGPNSQLHQGHSRRDDGCRRLYVFASRKQRSTFLGGHSRYSSQGTSCDEVEIKQGMEMNNFPSRSLGRTFESIIFSQGLVKR